MATLSPTSDIAIGAGIKMPNLINRFRVRFVDSDIKLEVPESQGLSVQLVSFDSTTTYRRNLGQVLNVSAIFEDDVTNVACKSLQNLMQRPGEQKFDIVVEQLGGDNGVLRSISYISAQVQSIDFPKLQYNAGFGPDIRIRLKTPKLNRGDLEDLKETNPLLYSVYELVNSTTVDVHSPEAFAAPNGASQFKVNFSYSHAEISYSN